VRFDGREYEVPVFRVGALFPPRAQMSGQSPGCSGTYPSDASVLVAPSLGRTVRGRHVHFLFSGFIFSSAATRTVYSLGLAQLLSSFALNWRANSYGFSASAPNCLALIACCLSVALSFFEGPFPDLQAPWSPKRKVFGSFPCSHG